jgi:DNA-binding transcriptional ArsR family regulator
MSVSEIYKKLKLEQSVASQHLAVLRNAHFVNTHRDGKYIYYSVNYQMLQAANRVIQELVTLR